MTADSTLRACQRDYEIDHQRERETEWSYAVDAAKTEIRSDPTLLAEAAIEEGQLEQLRQLMELLNPNPDPRVQSALDAIASAHAESYARMLAASE